MLLADLVLHDLPVEALVALKHAINDEILRRRRDRFVAKKKRNRERTPFDPSQPLPAYDEAILRLIQMNSEDLYSLPRGVHRANFRERLHYFPCLLQQDWTCLFPTADTTGAAFYVYAHIDPRRETADLAPLQIRLHGEPFYIGKGTQRRAWDLKRNEGHRKRMKFIRMAGFSDDAIVQIIANNLSEQEALILEAKLIYLFGSIYDETINGCLVNLADHMRPAFRRGMHKMPFMNAWKARRKAREEQLAIKP